MSLALGNRTLLDKHSERPTLKRAVSRPVGRRGGLALRAAHVGPSNQSRSTNISFSSADLNPTPLMPAFHRWELAHRPKSIAAMQPVEQNGVTR
jgi:hypothetical protein